MKTSPIGIRVTGLLLSALAVTVVVVCWLVSLGLVSLGWFSDNRQVTGDGQTVQVQSGYHLEIRATANGENIGVSAVEETMSKLPVDGDEHGLFPGTAGSFSFYVAGSAEDVASGYAYGFSLSARNNEFCQVSGFPERFYPNLSAQQKRQALTYLSSHLLFFTRCEDGVYSGWIRPDDTVRREVASGSFYQKETVYWVWIGEYADITENSRRLFDDPTQAEIAAYYAEPANRDTFTVNGEQTSEAYNAADTIIGITLKYICFQVEVVS